MLKALPGVERVRAKARKQSIELLFDESVQEVSAIAERLSTAGYATRVVGSKDGASGSGVAGEHS